MADEEDKLWTVDGFPAEKLPQLIWIDGPLEACVIVRVALTCIKCDLHHICVDIKFGP